MHTGYELYELLLLSYLIRTNMVLYPFVESVLITTGVVIYQVTNILHTLSTHLMCPYQKFLRLATMEECLHVYSL